MFTHLLLPLSLSVSPLPSLSPLPLSISFSPLSFLSSPLYTSSSLYLFPSPYRLILLRKKPTLLKLLCAGGVFLGLLLSLLPVITGWDSDSKEGMNSYLKASRASQILWPLCFMFGSVSDQSIKGAWSFLEGGLCS